MRARAGVLRSLTIACVAVCLSGATAAAVSGQATAPVGTIHTVALPGGVEGIRRALGDRRATAPASLIVEMTRRFHGGTADAADNDAVLARLRGWLGHCLRADDCGTPELPPDRVPLPGSPAFWREVVFERRVPEARLVPAILDRRDAALLYTALLSMREDVRAWMLARPALIRQLSRDGGPLLIAAPYLRLVDGRWELPGGPAAAPVWTALIGSSADASEAWLLALLRAHDGLLAYVVELMATLSPEQQQAAWSLGHPEASRRIGAGAELLDGVRAATNGWDVRERPFWRPSTDPAFLLGQVPSGGSGRLALPGGRAFWTLMFADGPLVPRAPEAKAAWDDPAPPSAGWLLTRVWLASPAQQAIRYEQVLFASRRLADATADHTTDVATIVRGYARYPQLLRVLDRLDIRDIGQLAAVVRRADALHAASADWRGHAAIVRWQCALLFVDSMARLGALEADELQRALTMLAGADQGSSLASRGKRVRALLTGLGVGAVDGDLPARPVEDALIARLTRSRIGAGRRVTWEGEAYRVDVGAAERDRIARVRGRDAQPRLDAAWAIYALAERDTPPDAGEALARLARVAAVLRLDRMPGLDDGLGVEARVAVTTARRLLEGDRPAQHWDQVRAALDDLGDVLATEGFAEMAYALSLGWAEDLPLTALTAARRHVFHRAGATGRQDASWVAPEIVTARGSAWHVAGSLLGLGDALAPVALRRPSLKPLAAAPTLNTGDRRWLVTTMAASDRRAFTDEAQQVLVTALARGEARVRAPLEPAAARELAADAGATPLRQALAAWTAQVNPAALRSVLSMTEVLRLGLAGLPVPQSLHGWGVTQRPVSGRVTTGPLPPWPWERYAGRSLRLVSCALPDLPLMLAVRLAALELPAMLVVDLMPSATYELVNTAASRHADDFDALAEHVRGIDQIALERHLGLLTTAGPLRPIPAASR